MELSSLLLAGRPYAPVVPFDAGKNLLRKLDFTSDNHQLTESILNDTEAFSNYIDQQLYPVYSYGIGGYNEHRTVYARSAVFDDDAEPRRLHLGIDIWGKAGTPVYAPLDGLVHSLGFNHHYGDYGAIIILQHKIAQQIFYTLYGHLSLRDVTTLQEGTFISRGMHFAHFGIPEENGHWPPHLHFQVIENIGDWKGDYPGVCKLSERENYLANCPDPDLLLDMVQYADRADV